jgi:hypothetical protein
MPNKSLVFSHLLPDRNADIFKCGELVQKSSQSTMPKAKILKQSWLAMGQWKHRTGPVLRMQGTANRTPRHGSISGAGSSFVRANDLRPIHWISTIDKSCAMRWQQPIHDL